MMGGLLFDFKASVQHRTYYKYITVRVQGSLERILLTPRNLR